MKRITENYDTYTKEELLAECHARGIEGVTSSSLKADIVAALELSDEQNTAGGTDDPAPNAPETPKPEESPIPHIGRPNIDNIPEVKSGDIPPQNKDFTFGRFKMKAYIVRATTDGGEQRESTLYPGEEFALCIHDPNSYGRTHSLKNSLHFWEGTEGQFQLQFEKA